MQVFEFHGCYFHGCPRCYTVERSKPVHKKTNSYDTMKSRLEATECRTQRLRDFGYDVVEKWECDFRSEMKANPEMEQFTRKHPLLINVPLNPRDAFYGGRTGNCKTYYEAVESEKIRYLDVCSLYPWVSLNPLPFNTYFHFMFVSIQYLFLLLQVCKYGRFPVGHPEVVVGHEACSLIDLHNTSGLIKCSVLPPRHLYHPVLPMKMNSKLMFVLCRECGENMNQDECRHAEEDRILHGTWVVEEVTKAIQMGYQVLEIQEIWRYQTQQYEPTTKSGGLFTKMMNDFIKYKQVSNY